MPSVSGFDLDVTAKLARMETKMESAESRIRELESECKELKEECEDLKAWKSMCTTTAAAWGIFLVGISTVCGALASYWPSITSLYNRLKP